MTWKLLKLVLFGTHCPNYKPWNPGESCEGRLRLRLELLQMWEGDFWEANFFCKTCGCQWRKLDVRWATKSEQMKNRRGNGLKGLKRGSYNV